MTGNQDPEEDRIAALLRGLPQEVPPPASLEQQTVTALRSRGFLRRGRSPWWTRAAVAALVVISFGAGWFQSAMRPSLVGNEPRYILLLYAGGSPFAEREESIVEEYRQWARGLGGTARAVSGERLDDRDGVVIGATSGAPSVGRARLQGYFIIEATDDREAVSIAERHPHVRRGGQIVVRKIDPT